MASFTQAQLDAARDNYARGVRVIQRGEEKLEFRSLQEMRQVISEMEQDLSGKAPRRQHYPSFSRGT